MKIRAALQTPVVELTISCTGVDKEKSKLKVGFKRYPTSEAESILKDLNELTKANREAHKTKPMEISTILGFSQEDVDKRNKEIEEFVEASDETKKAAIEAISVFIKEQIVYLKEVTFEDEEGKKYNIPTTQNVKLDEKLWKDEGYVDCLEWLLDCYLDSIWRDEILTGLYSVLLNRDLSEEAKRKN